ncbi:MAG: S9 family peptidase [Acidobacteriota bacterium]
MIKRLVTATLLCPLLQASVLLAQGSQLLTIDLLYDPEKKVDFDGSPPTITGWMKDGEHYLQRKEKRLFKVEARTGNVEPLIDPTRLREAFAQLAGITPEQGGKLAEEGSFHLSPDEQGVLISFQDDLFYSRLDGSRAARLAQTPAQEKEPAFSPDGRRVSFVRDHDLYVVNIRTKKERRLTKGGRPNLFNGLLDWVYQEEIYGRGHFKGYWWSPDSRRLAFLQLDESRVPGFTVVDRIPQHLKTELTRYPKAGDPNPRARLGILSASGGKTRWVDLSRYDPKDLLIVRVGWTPDSRSVVFQAQNREQTWLDLNLASTRTGKLRRLLRETSPAWVNVLGQPRWLKDNSFLWFSEQSGWRHLYHYSADGTLIGPVTSGQWEARRLHGVDEEAGWIYFSATQRSPIGVDVYKVKLDGSQLSRLSDRPGTHRARFNDDLSLFVDSWSDVKTPTQVRLYRSDGELVRVIDDNPAEELSKYRLGQPELLQVKTRDGFVMEALMIKPPGFDPSRKYPVMSHTYSGPHAPRVGNRWGGTTYLWHQLLAQKGYIIWICDNRTASGKGAQSTWPLHHHFGQLELRDLEDGLDWLKSHDWVDGSRIGLWGWSFGGYMTSFALTHSHSFKIGIVGAPVTDWTLYDTVYTERYMGTPQHNPEGYEKSSVLQAAGNLHGKLFLIHGTMDDNVHLQNSIRFIYELEKAGKQFNLMLYPKSRHPVRRPPLLKHLRVAMTNFILEHL